MIEHVKGNIFDSNAQALVNTVNTVGVMGKGLALQFREAFQHNYRVYKAACRRNELHIGELLIVEDSNLTMGTRLIVNFPTKQHWKYPSEYTYIAQGLTALRKAIEDKKISSIAIPPLGTHNGGLDWFRVKNMIETALADVDCHVFLYEPSTDIVDKMKQERVKLTPARALLIRLLMELYINGEFASVFAAEKLIYFMQRFGAKPFFKIDFMPYHYGPYSGGKVAHLLYSINGSYVTGMGSLESRPFDYLWLTEGAAQQAQAFINNYKDNSLQTISTQTMDFLRGFYSNYALELLASVDFLLVNDADLALWRSMDNRDVIDKLADKIRQWSKRKSSMFKRNYLELAVEHLRKSNI